MNDKEILHKVYEMLCPPEATREKPLPSASPKAIRDFIHQEWQKRDEQELVDQYNRNRAVKDHVSTTDQIQDASLYAAAMGYLDDYSSDPCTTDVKEIERHRGLEIGSDGTVTNIK